MFIDPYKTQIQILCKENKVKYLFVFGSVVTADFNENSDIDFIVDIDSLDPIDYADHYFALKFSLEDLLKRPIDLLEKRQLKIHSCYSRLNRLKHWYMDLEIKKWLKDIELAISEINSFFPEKKVFAEFQNDVKSRKAVERNIEIIGEALSRILKIKPDIRISDARKIVDTRNRIIHGYDSISAEIIWLILIRNLQVLEKEVKELLD